MNNRERRQDELQAFENGQNIRDRTRAFAIRVVKFCKDLDKTAMGRNLSPQIVKAANSVAANLEEARAAESTDDFISKCCISLKECRESHVRLTVVVACELGAHDDARALCAEANELVAIITAIVRNTKRNAARRAEQAKAARTNEDRPIKQRRSKKLRILNS